MDEKIDNNAAAAKDTISDDSMSHPTEPGNVATDNQNTARHHSINRGDDSNTPGPSTEPAMAPQGPPPLEELASQRIRTHRDWTPKYGRVQKCDWCNGRSAGTLQVCSSCSLRMCEDCARTRRWHSNRSHFIDADACDWSLKKPARPAKPTKPAKPAKTRGTKRAASAVDDDEPRRKVAKKARSRNDEEDDDIADDDDDDVSNHEPRRPQGSSPTDARDDADHRRPRPSATNDGHRQAALPHRRAQPDTIEPATESPKARPSRKAAARAIVGMSELARRSSDDGFDEDGEENDEDYDDQDDDGKTDVVKKKGVAEKVNDPLRRRGNPPAHNNNAGGRPLSHARADREQINSPQVGAMGHRPLVHRAAPTPEDIEHDQIILDIYDWVYATRPHLDPRRARTQIPDSWAGDLQAAAPHYGRESSPYGYNTYPAPHYPPPGYGQYPMHAAPPAPMGYPPQGYHHYQEYAQHPNPGYGPAPLPSGPYPPATPSNLSYHHPSHPFHDHQPPQQHHNNPAEQEHARQDRQTLDEMINAWMHNPLLLRLAHHENRRVYAIGLLWDVFEVRRMFVYVRNDSQTVRWFVSERDRQFRIQHSASAVQGPGYPQQQQQQMMVMRARSMTPAPVPVVRGQTPVPVRGQTPVPVRGVTPAPAPVMGQTAGFVRGQTPVGFSMPAGHMQGQWAGMAGHVNQAVGVHQAEAADGGDAHSENDTIMQDGDGNDMAEEE